MTDLCEGVSLFEIDGYISLFVWHKACLGKVIVTCQTVMTSKIISRHTQTVFLLFVNEIIPCLTNVFVLVLITID